jgi:hypothetical protein
MFRLTQNLLGIRINVRVIQNFFVTFFTCCANILFIAVIFPDNDQFILCVTVSFIRSISPLLL